MTSGPPLRRASAQDDVDAALDCVSGDAAALGRGAPTLQVLGDSHQSEPDCKTMQDPRLQSML